jgi:hypothetical protein
MPFHVPLERRGRRESRAPTAPASPCAKTANNAHGFDRYSRDIPAFPAQWLYGLYVLSPGKRPFLPPLPAGLTANVAPGSRRQDHTISPYAADVSSGERTRLTPQRPSQPAPTFRDDREASPYEGTGWQMNTSDLPGEASGIFVFHEFVKAELADRSVVLNRPHSLSILESRRGEPGFRARAFGTPRKDESEFKARLGA